MLRQGSTSTGRWEDNTPLSPLLIEGREEVIQKCEVIAGMGSEDRGRRQLIAVYIGLYVCKENSSRRLSAVSLLTHTCGATGVYFYGGRKGSRWLSCREGYFLVQGGLSLRGDWMERCPVPAPGWDKYLVDGPWSTVHKYSVHGPWSTVHGREEVKKEM